MYVDFVGSDSISGGKHAMRNPLRHMPSFSKLSTRSALFLDTTQCMMVFPYR